MTKTKKETTTKKKDEKKDKPKKPLTMLQISYRQKALEKQILAVNQSLNRHINDPSITIMIRDKGSMAWNEWTGSFSLDYDDKEKSLAAKVEKHFYVYFAKQYPGKEFAIIDRSKNRIYKIIKGD
jgi:hypothetical protein